jgi:DNA polymerase/3'-5' exonuclease PolX
MDNNKTIAGLLRQIGALHEAEGVPFKPAAYRHAAQVTVDPEKRTIIDER